MKIAVMTQPLGRNYGGIMQAWALQQVLKRQGHEVITINRQQDERTLLYKMVRFSYRTTMNMIGKRKLIVDLEGQLPYIQRNNLRFISDNISMSEKIDSTIKLKSHFDREGYDAVVVGSDQTWRPKYSPKIENYYLDFLAGENIKRIAYASSFGVDDWEYTEAQTQLFSALLRQFDAVSVREDSGVWLCRKYLNVEVQHVLDPTMLLNKEDYEHLIGKDRLKNKFEGIFTYFLDKTPEKFALAEKASKETGEVIYSCQAKYSLGDNVAANIDDYVMPDPRDWLAGFANAKYVLTDSFHGMVFSIIFNKQFFVLDNVARGSARFHSLLGALNLLDRIVSSIPSENMCCSFNGLIDYSSVRRELLRIQDSSISFLQL